MLHFRSPAAENDLPPALDLRAGSVSTLKPVAIPEFAASGFANGSVVETARGPVLARDLRLGDRLLTRDNGLQPVRWIGTSTVMYDDEQGSEAEAHKHGPVRIRAGAQGSSPDAGNLILAPGQRVLARNPMNEILFATDEVLASAGDLTHLDGVDLAPRGIGRWTHVLLDIHDLIRVNGLWMESFAPDMWSIRVAYPEQWQDMIEAMPRLRYENAAASYVESRLSLDSREARMLDSI